MISLLIVDDQKHQVDSLATTMPWEQYGITKIHTAYSGQSASEIIRTHPIDILITDIRMPGISGLELIEYANEQNKKVDCILLTGYAEFEYAKQAIELHAIYYLIKPVRDEVLLDAISKIVDKRQNERQQHQIFEYATSIVHQNLPLLKENLLLELLQNTDISINQLTDKLDMYRIPIAYGQLVKMAAIKLDPYFYESYGAADMKLLQFAVLNMAEELLSEPFHIWACIAPQGHLIMLLLPKLKEGQSDVQWDSAQENIWLSLANKLTENVDYYLKGQITVYVSNPAQFPEEIHSAYSSIVSKLMKSNQQRGMIVSAHQPTPDRDIKPLRSLYEQPLLLRLMDTGNREKLNLKLSDIFAELEHSQSDSHAHLREAYLHMLSCFTYLAHKKGKVLEDIIGTASNRAEHNVIHSAKLLKAWSLVILDALFDEGPLHVDDNHRQLVNKIHSFIEQHLGTDVTLQSIGDSVYLNAIYLSQIYKEITGENLSEYILRVRMEKAKILLEQSSYRIYEITERVGYQSSQHFIRTFKKYYGVTPEIYRKR
ncbi:two-component system response regulator YesN [Paenibacillus endophyticus]|uniref:Two-component system response regulator YesN n=1 Tax=Paenibacillus endophyticus TaxID=1294268 RepID=A0A7W5G9N0_9BACL|nr:response regulator [Paenibacillus endophyticus]MBB3151870.1 two-component system response regulator YesN [Paenibacillus endophyticus]